MASKIDRLLAEFVNRETEMASFVKLLDDPDQNVFAIWGDGGVGKSYLMAKMLHEVSNRNLPRAEVLVTNTRNTDYLSIMRKIRDDLGSDQFFAFTDMVNFFTVPQYELNINIEGGSNVSVLRSGKISGDAQVGDVAGVIIKDVMLSDPRPDRDVPDEERLTRLTDAFIDCLQAMDAGGTRVIFLDAVEKLSDRTARWLWEELLDQVRANELISFNFVVCGRKEPSLHRDWQDAASVHELKSLTLEHIKQYLERRGVPGAVDDVAMALLVTSEGNMLRLATAVDGFLKLKASAGQ